MKTHIYILRGGLVGFDGFLPWVSGGMDALRLQIVKATGITPAIANWNDYANTIRAIRSLPDEDQVIVIGYSGGGVRAIDVVRALTRKVQLLILYDPSPAWQIRPIGPNVIRALCYHNNQASIFFLGGGLLKGPQVEEVTVTQDHLAVQTNQDLHRRTIEAIKLLL